MGKKLRLLLAVTMAVAVGTVAMPSSAQAQTVPAVGTDFGAAGPYRVTTTPDGEHTFFHPSDPGEGGVRHPVILWGNGTGTTPTSYSGLLRHFASHGFVVAAANTTNAMSGAEMLAGLDKLTAWNSASGNRFQGAIDLENVGATGHSQGAFGATTAGRDARVDTVFPLQGGSRASNVESAIFFAGGSDAIVSPGLVRGGYSSTRVPAAYAELAGASHFAPIGSGGGFRPVATAWARMELMDDANARPMFRGASCGLCTSGEWTYETNPAFDGQQAPPSRPAPTPPTTQPAPPVPQPAPPTTQPEPPAEEPAPPTTEQPAPPTTQPEPPAENPDVDSPSERPSPMRFWRLLCSWFKSFMG